MTALFIFVIFSLMHSCKNCDIYCIIFCRDVMGRACVCLYEEGKGREKDKTSPKIKDGRVLMSTLRFAQLLWQRAGSLLQATSLHIWWNTHTHTLECKEQPQASVICIGFPGPHNTEQLSKHGTLYGGQKRHLSVRQRVCQTGTVTQRVAARAFNRIIQDCRAETTPDGWGWWGKKTQSQCSRSSCIRTSRTKHNRAKSMKFHCQDSPRHMTCFCLPLSVILQFCSRQLRLNVAMEDEAVQLWP